MLLDQYGKELQPIQTKRLKKSFATRARFTTDRDTIVPYSSFQTYKTSGGSIDWKLGFLKEEDLVRKDAMKLLKSFYNLLLIYLALILICKCLLILGLN